MEQKLTVEKSSQKYENYRFNRVSLHIIYTDKTLIIKGETQDGEQSYTYQNFLRISGYITEGLMGGILEHVFPEYAYLTKWCDFSALTTFEDYLKEIAKFTRTRIYPDKELNEPIRWEKAVYLGKSAFPLKFPLKFMSWLERFNNNFRVVEIKHPYYESKYTISDYTKHWSECFFTENEAKGFVETVNKYGYKIVDIPVEWNTSIEPHLGMAQKMAMWADATLEDLSDKDKLFDHFTKLQEEFKIIIEKLGFVY